VEIKAQAADQESMLMQIFISWFPMLLLIGVWVFFMRQMQGGAGGKGGPMSFGKSKARMLEEDQIKVTFADVAGCAYHVHAKHQHQRTFLQNQTLK
jgi:cell division protease FtsH